jgi:hypothetical protein
LWGQFDKNGDGCIAVDELMQVMKELGAEGDQQMEVDQLMALVDLDHNGLISLEEFEKFRCRLGLLMQLPRADEATWQTLQLCLAPQAQPSASSENSRAERSGSLDDADADGPIEYR